MSAFSWVRGFTYPTHLGIDLSASTGTPIHAVASGRVIYAGDTRRDPSPPWWSSWQGAAGAAGIAVAVDGGEGRTTYYLHQQRVAVTVGQSVDRGSIVGYVDTTGDATGPHVHFALTLGGRFVDPLTVWSRQELIDTIGGKGSAPAPGPGGSIGITKPQFDAWYACIGAQPWDTITPALAVKMSSCAAAGGIDLATAGLDPSTYVGRAVRDFALAMSQSTGRYIGPETVVNAVLSGLAGALTPILWLFAILVLIVLGLYVTLTPGGSSA